jgi:molecular chaperone HscB
MNLQANDFELFGLVAQFAQDLGEIDARWKDLQRQAHPDKFAAEGPAAQRVAAQYSARINEARERLRNPLKRAAYLCELRGAPIAAESNTAMPAEFLMQQMEWREALAEAQNTANLDQIGTEQTSYKHSLLSKLEQLLAEMASREQAKEAATLVRAWMFVEKFESELELAYERLDD